MKGRRGALAAWCLLLVMAGQGVAAQNTTALLKVYLAFKGTAIPLPGGQESETINAMNALCNVPWDFRAQVGLLDGMRPAMPVDSTATAASPPASPAGRRLLQSSPAPAGEAKPFVWYPDSVALPNATLLFFFADVLPVVPASSYKDVAECFAAGVASGQLQYEMNAKGIPATEVELFYLGTKQAVFKGTEVPGVVSTAATVNDYAAALGTGTSPSPTPTPSPSPTPTPTPSPSPTPTPTPSPSPTTKPTPMPTSKAPASNTTGGSTSGTTSGTSGTGSTTGATTTANETTDSSGSLSTGVIIGIVCGVAGAIIILVVVIALALNSKRKKKDESNTDIMRHRWKLERELAAAQRAKAMGALSGPYSSSSAYQGQTSKHTPYAPGAPGTTSQRGDVSVAALEAVRSMRRGESLRAASSLGSRDLNHDSYDVYRMQRPDTARETLGLGRSPPGHVADPYSSPYADIGAQSGRLGPNEASPSAVLVAGSQRSSEVPSELHGSGRSSGVGSRLKAAFKKGGSSKS